MYLCVCIQSVLLHNLHIFTRIINQKLHRCSQNVNTTYIYFSLLSSFKYFHPQGGAMLGQLVESDYLLDFDIFHVSHVTELLHYIDAKYLSSELGGTNDLEVDTWLNIQQHVDIFTVNATHTARKLAAFMRLLHQDDNKADFKEVTADGLKYLHVLMSTLQVAERNRNYYQQLRVELEDVTRQGVIMLDRLEDDQAASSSSAIQRLAVQRLCGQLETTWHYFTNTFRVQVGL